MELYVSKIGLTTAEQNAVINWLRRRKLDFHYISGSGTKRGELIVNDLLKQSIIEALKTRTQANRESDLVSGVRKLNHYFNIDQNAIPAKPDTQTCYLTRVKKAKGRLPDNAMFFFEMIDTSTYRAGIITSLERAGVWMPKLPRGNKDWYYMTPDFWDENKDHIKSKIRDIHTSLANKTWLKMFCDSCERHFG